MGKYDPLTTFLCAAKKDNVTLTFSEIERILGFELPKSSYSDSRWWLNNDKTHTQSAAWGNAGYEVTSSKLGEYITFTKK